jgi:DNA-directed RNA polymerase subunit M/transcription elongation factor TFIIS
MSMLVHTLHLESRPDALPATVRPALRQRAVTALTAASKHAEWARVYECACASQCIGRQAYCDRVMATLAYFSSSPDALLFPPTKTGGADGVVAGAAKRAEADTHAAQVAAITAVKLDLNAVDAALKLGIGGTAQDPCKKCGSQDTFTVSKQTRGADEGATMLCTCKHCGATWKYNS